MKTNKKAVVFYEPLIVLGFFVALTTGILLTLSNARTTLDKPVGKTAVELLQQTYGAESDLFYLDQAASYAAKDAVFELGANSFQMASSSYSCNSEQLPAALQIAEIPKMQEIAATLIKITKRNLDGYISQNPLQSQMGYWLKNTDYEFYAEANPLKISGIAVQPAEIGIFAGEGENRARLGDYYLKPSFTAEINYDLNVYDRIKKGVAELNNAALDYVDAEEQLITDTLKTKAAELNQNQQELVWEISKAEGQEKVYAFKITQNIAIPLCSQKPVIQFKMKIPSALEVSA